MPAFPKSESEVLQLANKMIGGLPQDPIFASAPATPSQLQSATDTFNAASAEMDAAYSLYLSKSQNKNASYVALQGLMKQDINFAENAPGVTQAQLHLIGWDTKAPPTKLEAPGQCLQFELIGVSGHLYDFDWKKTRHRRQTRVV